MNFVLLVVLLVAAGGARANAQMPSSAESGWPQSSSAPGAAASMAIGPVGGQSPFTGSTPTGAATAQEMPLSLQDAIADGLKSNLGLLLSRQETEAAQGVQWVERSALLPHLTAHVAESEEQINLEAFGFSNFPGLPPVIGPFSNFDARPVVQQQLDLSAWSRTRAAEAGTQASGFSYQDAREMVVSVVANLYFRAIAGAARVDAAHSQLQTAEALFRQATDFKNSGVVPAIEVLRAQVEYQAQQQRVISLENEEEKDKLDLARAVGLPTGQQFHLTDTLSEAAPPALDLPAARERALGARADYQNLQALVRQAEHDKKAAEQQRLPTLSLHGDYGDTGFSPTNSHGTFTASAALDFPIFQGGRVRGEVLQADALLAQRKAQLEDLRSRVDYELQTAQLDLTAAQREVEVARGARDLATDQMAQAQDRFTAGVASNIEVVQAQEALATAHENYISSLYSLNVAKIALARALGGAENNLAAILRGEMQ